MTLKYPFLCKLLFVTIAYFAHGASFETPLDYFYALLVTFFIIFGEMKSQVNWRFCVFGIILLGIGYAVPQLQIPEQQGILLTAEKKPITPEEFLTQERDFVYAPSADGYRQGLSHSRLVSTLKHEGGILALRSGWANHRKYNFYEAGEPQRAEMPFVVKYIITPAMAGMRLQGEGVIYFTAEPSSNFSPRKISINIEANHSGHALYAFGGKWDDKVHALSLSLEKTYLYAFYDVLRLLALFAGLTFLFTALMKLKTGRDHSIEMLLFAGVSAAVYLFYGSIFNWGILVKGGNDGIVHGGYPYEMLAALIEGDWYRALMSPEDVFYYMPGMRYIRFLEMLVFGDAYIFQICMLSFVSVILYRFYRCFLSSTAALILVAASINTYITGMVAQFGEWLCYAFFFWALTLTLKKFKTIKAGFFAFVLFSLALTIRPNLLLFIGVLGLVHFFSNQFSSLSFGSRFVMMFGLSPVLLMPLHNLIGGQFVLATSASTIVANMPLTLNLYSEAFSYLFGFTDQFLGVDRFLLYKKYLSFFYFPALLFFIWLSVKTTEKRVRILSVACLSGMLIHLFYIAAFRYTVPYIHIAVMLLLYQIRQVNFRNYRWVLRDGA